MTAEDASLTIVSVGGNFQAKGAKDGPYSELCVD